MARLNLHVSCNKGSLETAALPVWCDQSLKFTAVSAGTKQDWSLKVEMLLYLKTIVSAAVYIVKIIRRLYNVVDRSAFKSMYNAKLGTT